MKRKSKRIPVFLSEEEFFKILNSTNNKRHKLAFSLGFFAGLRVSEVANLKPENIDFNLNWIHIKRGKGDKDRNVPLPKHLKTKLKKLLPLGCGVRALQIAFKKALKKSGVNKDAHFHTLRHSCATTLLQKGHSLVDVQRILGHSRIDTTGIYLHVNPTDLQEKFNKAWE